MKCSNIAVAWVLTALAGCGNGTTNPGVDGGSDMQQQNGAGIQFSASGEVLALGGYAYPPVNMGDAAFVDGWQIHFSKLLVTIDKIKLWTNPDTSATDQSQVGTQVAELDGPWAIDLHKGGPLPGKGGGNEQAYPIATLDNQNKNGNAPFDPTMRYAFGFDLIPATASATRLQLDANDPDYAEMISKGYVVLYVGTATWKGNGAGGAACTTTNAAFDFTQEPFKGDKTVNFRFGFKSPTSYINCQNPDNDPAMGLGMEDHQRGVQVKAGQTVTAQVTVHTDHPFWESFTHDTPAHFDQLAALAKMDGAGNWNVTLDDTVGVNYKAFKFNGTGLPWRACLAGYTPPDTNMTMDFDSLTIPYNPAGTPATSMRDYNDYMTYDQSTQGHLNSDGLCFVQRHYPSPN
ncbi:MAG TPA: hypothetical protein VFF06_08860 [Polyangia bacterium]|nr:hypothetical protein [Polyangia bacterium]